jgi:hypothetical protein
MIIPSSSALTILRSSSGNWDTASNCRRETAAACALNLIKAELDETGMLLNEIDNPPFVTVVGIEKMRFFRRHDFAGKGFTFFPEGEQLQPGETHRLEL